MIYGTVHTVFQLTTVTTLVNTPQFVLTQEFKICGNCWNEKMGRWVLKQRISFHIWKRAGSHFQRNVLITGFSPGFQLRGLWSIVVYSVLSYCLSTYTIWVSFPAPNPGQIFYPWPLKKKKKRGHQFSHKAGVHGTQPLKKNPNIFIYFPPSEVIQ